MLSPYRQILARPGAVLFSLTGLFARLPISMVSLGLVLLVEAATGSYGLAGAVAATYTVANAALAILQGRLLDRFGQALVLRIATVLFGGFLVLATWSVQAGWPSGLTYVFAAAAGGSLPQIGSCVRARWAHTLDSATELQTAYALESAADEAVFVLGPVLVTVLATAVHPVAGLGTAVVAGVLGTFAFAAQRRTEPPARRLSTDGGARAAMPWRTVIPLAVVCAGLGVLFGAAEVTTVAFAEEQHAQQYAGVLLALWATGSLVAGLVSGAIQWRSQPGVRVRWGALCMALALVPLVFLDSMWLMGAVMLVGGLAIAPTLVAAMSLTERSVPRSRLTEGMAIMHTGLLAGVAPGATLSGIVVDHSGASAAYLVSIAAGLVAMTAAWLLPRER